MMIERPRLFEGRSRICRKRARGACISSWARCRTLAGTDALRLIAELTPAETGNDEALSALAPFLSPVIAGPMSPRPRGVLRAGRAA
jgi:hypothetical protein